MCIRDSLDVDLRAVWAAEKSARRSNELSGGGCKPEILPVPEPMPAVPLLMAGLSRSASASGVAGLAGRAAFARVGRAGSLFVFCGFLGGFAIASNMGRVRGRGKGSLSRPRAGAILGKNRGGCDGRNQTHQAHAVGRHGLRACLL